MDGMQIVKNFSLELVINSEFMIVVVLTSREKFFAICISSMGGSF